MMLYIHGFGSCGDSNKTRLLKSHFGEENVLAPDVPVAPEEAMEFLGKLIQENDITMLIGSSLGGFYATALSNQFSIDAVLINPSCHPYRTLAPYIGENDYWCNDETFEWKGEYLMQLARIAENMQLPDTELMVLLQTDDEVLDYTVAADIYKEYFVIIEEGGNHRFENLDDYLVRIESFYKNRLEG
ncbi:MAG: YqiA/YcfP family alpha/beta fold hydrolase [Sulfurimonadaceae bacterium]|nr:YqiA/YcfP family alpha/beta fold hydrolase [Sulfurimonadaceae bacterium]